MKPLLVFSVFILCSLAVPAQTESEDPAPMRPLASKSMMLDLARAGENLVAAGDRGHILISSDQGKTWNQSKVPTRVLLTALTFVDEKTGWAVGHNETLLKSEDAGQSWQIVRQDFERDPFLHIWFENKDHGLVAGAYGVMLETFDGGETWEEVFLNDEDDFHLNQIGGSGNGTIYIASERDNLNERGVSYRSMDSGKTWERMLMPYSGSYFGVLPIDETSVIFFGLRGQIFRSTDQGTNWSEIKSGTFALLTDALKTSKGEIFIVGMGGTVLKSVDQGQSFSIVKQTHQSSFSAIAEASDGSLILAGEGGFHFLEQ